jgi:hypothetical protein
VPIKPPDDGMLHTVTSGDWAGSVSMRFGFADWEKEVWQHPENNRLKELRKDPHVLAPGDVLFIPPWEDHTEDCATEKKHTFKLKTPTEVLRIQVLDAAGEPLKNAEYKLELTYGPGGGEFKQKNKATDGEGMLEEMIPSTSTSGILRMPESGLEIQLDLGHLAPLKHDEERTRILGAQQRLRALGYYKGEPDGEMDGETREAITAFQKICKQYPDHWKASDPGEINGELSEKTLKAIEKYYGC